MAKEKERGITFGDWMLAPLDERNWELCHRHETTRGKNAGEVKWHHVGRYYQYDTFGNALAYAADCDLKAELDGTVEICDALDRYEAIMGEHWRRCAASFAEVG